MRWRVTAMSLSAAFALALLVRCGSFSGTNDSAPIDDASTGGEGGTVSEGGGGEAGPADGGPSRFCDQYPAKPGSLCFDFDDPQFPPEGLAQTLMGDGKLVRAPSDLSPPYALQARMAKGVALLQSSPSNKVPATKLRIRAALKAPAEISDTNVNLAAVGQHVFMLVFDSSTGIPATVAVWIKNTSTGKGDYVCVKVGYVANTWFSVDLAYDFASSTTTGTINGATCEGAAADVPYPSADAGQYTLAANIGADYTRDGGIAVLVDNYAVGLE